MYKHPSFSQAIDSLRILEERDQKVVAQDLEQQETVAATALGIEQADLWSDSNVPAMFIDPLFVYDVLYGPGLSDLSELIAGEYPQPLFALVEKFGLLRGGKPAKWAVDLVNQVVRFGPEVLHPQLNTTWTFQRNISIDVSPQAGRVTTFKWTSAEQKTTVSTDDVWSHPGTEPRFGSNKDWDELQQIAESAARLAVEELRNQYMARYDVSRNPGRDRRWEITCKRLASQLTGHFEPRLKNDTRSRFCKAIGMDNPVTHGKRQ